MRKTAFDNDTIYHLCNRSTEGIPIFQTVYCAKKFLKILNECNTTGEGIRGISRHPQKVYKKLKQDKALVEVYALVLMPNHFHILVKQLVDGGISKWMQRSCNSFAKVFNLTKNRKGALFMGRFQAIPALDDRQLFHLFIYIHANPLDLIFPAWRNGSVKSWNKTKSFLQSYQWSSFGLYSDQSHVVNSNIKQLIKTKAFSEFLLENDGLEKGIKSWSRRQLDSITDLLLE